MLLQGIPLQERIPVSKGPLLPSKELDPSIPEPVQPFQFSVPQNAAGEAKLGKGRKRKKVISLFVKVAEMQ